MLPVEFIIELFAYLIILTGVYFFSGIHEYMRKLNRSVFLFLVLFFYLLVVGQVNKTPSQTYPFVNWSMYSQKTPRPSYTEHIITLQDGTRVHYPYEYITFTSPRAFMRKVENIEGGARDSSSNLLYDTVEGLVEIYEKRHPGNEVTSFSFFENKITIPGSGVGYETTVREIFKYEFKK